MSKARVGKEPWNKNKKGVMPIPWNKGTKGICKAWNKGLETGIKPWLGKKRPKEMEKMRIANIGRKHTRMTRQKQSNAHKGEKSYSWKGGITPKNKIIRRSIELRLWREAVFARDNFTDQKTKIRGGKLHAHHIQNFAQYPELRTSIENGITFSKESHKEFHKIYGIKNNTKEQIQEFLKLK